ncbi:TetR/AcrR family transcriptional regulator [Nocardioides humi]|uniref:TetR/AcrR family transcriptional regulator n=1 Tax=Nocardioides humi TaxID=449461 RepID=A0ABN2AIZ9_9ACTN|nr:TetR/AcrR family transcriptional regulator [Nocardioides humi]
MPTGVHLQDARQQLFDAAERILLRDGPSALTSRAVTDEAGCAKGVLHRHFTDFDGFLAELILDRAAQMEEHSARLMAALGVGAVEQNLARALSALFRPVPVAILPLITFRDELRIRLRELRPGGGIAILSDATRAVSAYLAAEREAGRLSAAADIDALTLSLVGGGHLLLADRHADRPGPAAVERFVTATPRDALTT